MAKCAGASHADTWDHMVIPPCPWKLARSTHGTLNEESFFSDHDALLFQLGEISTDPRCPGLQFRPTEFSELALIQDKPHLPSFTRGDVTSSAESTLSTSRINCTASPSMGSPPTTRPIVRASLPVYVLAS